jgi:GGDEF domain-containing protein
LAIRGGRIHQANTDKAGAIEVAEKLRLALGRIDVAELGRGISGSFGAAVLPDDAPEPEQLVRMADHAMYLRRRHAAAAATAREREHGHGVRRRPPGTPPARRYPARRAAGQAEAAFWPTSG